LKPDKDVTDPRLVKALAHPLRLRILGVLDERMASPSELAEELNAPLGNVSYHVRILASLGLIQLVKETPRRGSVEHHYQAVARPMISDDAWAAVPETVKRAMVGAVLQEAGRLVSDAAAHGGFDRPNSHLSRTPLRLDAEGWKALADELIAFMRKVEEIESGAAERLGPHEGDEAMLVLMLFQTIEVDDVREDLLGDDEHHQSNSQELPSGRR
jgi:DNA-binding transcriptional ArsR family regulator